MRIFLRTAGAILMLFGVCLLGIITSSLFNEKIALGVESTVSALSEAVAEAADRAGINEYITGGEADN